MFIVFRGPRIAIVRSLVFRYLKCVTLKGHCLRYLKIETPLRGGEEEGGIICDLTSKCPKRHLRSGTS